MKKPTVYDCPVIELPELKDSEADIISIHGRADIPFEIKRVFYSYNIPDAKTRGAHAHKECHQLLIAAGGSYEVELDDGENKRTVLLDNPCRGLHILPGIWASERGFSEGAICLVLASHGYDESDYIRGYQEFLTYAKNATK